MNLDLDVNKLVELVKPLLEQVTCINCGKYYSAPSTSVCGHSLCHTSCWRFRSTCPKCNVKVDKEALRLNSTLQIQTEHAIALVLQLESLYNINIDEFTLETQEQDHVKQWLASPENQFSAPVTNSQSFTEIAVHSVQKVTSDVQIHTENMKPKEPEKAISKLNVQQDDWDKIEVIPETENITKNTVGPMDIETFDCITYEKDFNVENPRRSLRNKELKTYNPAVANDVSSDKSGRSYKANSNQIKSKSGQNWKNVKRMKKEFSKLKKDNKNKLNVSIEMVKKSNLSMKKGILLTPQNQADEKIKEINSGIPTSEIKTSKVSFFKRAPLLSTEINKHANRTNFANPNNSSNNNNNNTVMVDSDDIEITIKIGKSLTKFKIQKKENDTMQLKVNTDREVQTSLVSMENEHNVHSTVESTQAQQVENINVENGYSVKDSNDKDIVLINNKNIIKENKNPVSTQCSTSNGLREKSVSMKKNTISADTSTANFDISESEEKAFAEVMDTIPSASKDDKNESQKSSEVGCTSKSKSPIQQSLQNLDTIQEDIDIFEGESVKENNKNDKRTESAKSPSSAILMPTAKSKSRTQKITIKRTRDTNDTENLPKRKKIKETQEIIANDKKGHMDNILEVDSENINYDDIMSQVFANINIDMENLQKTRSTQLPTQISDTQKSSSKDFVLPMKPNTKQIDSRNKTTIQKTSAKANEKYSENVFSLLEKENNSSEIIKTSRQMPFEPSQPHKNNSQIPLQEPNDDAAKIDEIPASQHNLDDIEFGTPMQEDDDKSFVEETPQKDASISKVGDNNEMQSTSPAKCAVTEKKNNMDEIGTQQNDMDIQESMNVISISSESKVESSEARKTVLDTPASITKFVDKITNDNRSTPIARKSLNFYQNVDNDPEETICPSAIPATTTQEREFLSKAFEPTLVSPSQTLAARHRRAKKLCLAGTCLRHNEIATLKQLCAQRNWTFVDKYTEDLTHLVVSVDEHNTVQRTVKYLCALASGKWIVSYAWVERCIQINGIADEEAFEALDVTGEPGPRRSRLAKQKLLRGISFYCMPPFTTIDVETLKEVVVAAGGRVLQSPREASASEAPAMLLAEPEHTQEDRFIYMAMELKIVPVNYEWIINCLGVYGLKSISELLLCPAALLPSAVARWPPDLIAPCDE